MLELNFKLTDALRQIEAEKGIAMDTVLDALQENYPEFEGRAADLIFVRRMERARSLVTGPFSWKRDVGFCTPIIA